MAENARLVRKERTGVVVSDKMDKTITVRVDRAAHHPVYKKMVKQSKKYKAHDENKTAKMGDIVRIQETRPLSKTKRWRLVEVVKAANAAVQSVTEPKANK